MILWCWLHIPKLISIQHVKRPHGDMTWWIQGVDSDGGLHAPVWCEQSSLLRCGFVLFPQKSPETTNNPKKWPGEVCFGAETRGSVWDQPWIQPFRASAEGRWRRKKKHALWNGAVWRRVELGSRNSRELTFQSLRPEHPSILQSIFTVSHRDFCRVMSCTGYTGLCHLLHRICALYLFVGQCLLLMHEQSYNWTLLASPAERLSEKRSTPDSRFCRRNGVRWTVRNQPCGTVGKHQHHLGIQQHVKTHPIGKINGFECSEMNNDHQNSFFWVAAEKTRLPHLVVGLFICIISLSILSRFKIHFRLSNGCHLESSQQPPNIQKPTLNASLFKITADAGKSWAVSFQTVPWKKDNLFENCPRKGKPPQNWKWSCWTPLTDGMFTSSSRATGYLKGCSSSTFWHIVHELWVLWISIVIS